MKQQTFVSWSADIFGCVFQRVCDRYSYCTIHVSRTSLRKSSRTQTLRDVSLGIAFVWGFILSARFPGIKAHTVTPSLLNVSMWSTYICPWNILPKTKKKNVHFGAFGRKESFDIDSIDPALLLDWSVFGWVNSVSRLWREMQSNVVAACNECFPVGWTVTLWMAGDSGPEGERIRDSCHLWLQTNLNR